MSAPNCILVFPMDSKETEELERVLSSAPRLLTDGAAQRLATPHGFAAFLRGVKTLEPVRQWLLEQREDAAFILRGSGDRLFCSHGALEAMEGRRIDLVAGVFATVPEAAYLRTREQLPRRR